jgi:hypothetical protein
MGDVNGDNRDDIVGFGIAGVTVALATGGGNFGPPSLALAAFGTSAAAGAWGTNSITPRRLGDVNGDGRADIVGFDESGVVFALGTPSGGFSRPMADIAAFGADFAAGGWSSNDALPRVLGDADGDLRDDVIAFGHGGVVVSTAVDLLI